MVAIVECRCTINSCYTTCSYVSD